MRLGKRQYIWRDIGNFLLYGKDMPLCAQLIYINPNDVKMVLSKPFKRNMTGMVLDGDWDKQNYPIELLEKYNICVKRFVDGASWEDAGAYKLMENLMENSLGVDGCYTEADVAQRYAKLDLLFDTVKTEKKLRLRKEMSPKRFRETGGVYVHIGRGGGYYSVRAVVTGLQ